jgi:hypothetical protein
MTEDTLGAILAQAVIVAASVAFVIGIGAGFLMSNKINGDADERTARLFNIICEANK